MTCERSLRAGRRAVLALAAIAAASALPGPRGGMAGLPAAYADPGNAVGLWQSIDDASGKPKALIRISESGGVLSGRIEKLLADKPDAVCEKCEGELKDKPIAGMTIIQGLKKGEDWYEDGTILDPNNGKTYRCRLKAIEGGAKLEVRGFIGSPLLGRTQTWVRQP